MLEKYKKFRKTKSIINFFAGIIMFFGIFAVLIYTIQILFGIDYANDESSTLSGSLSMLSIWCSIIITRILIGKQSYLLDLKWIKNNLKTNDKEFEDFVIYLINKKIIDDEFLYNNTNKINFDKKMINKIKKIYLSIYKIPEIVLENINNLIYKDFEEYDKKSKLIIGTPSNQIISMPFDFIIIIYYLAIFVFFILSIISVPTLFIYHLSNDFSTLWLILIIPITIYLSGSFATNILVPIADFIDKFKDYLISKFTTDLIHKEFLIVNNKKYYWNEINFDDDFENINIENLKYSKYTIVKRMHKIIEGYNSLLIEFPITFRYKGEKVTFTNFKNISYKDYIQGICYYYFYKIKGVKFNLKHENEEIQQKEKDINSNYILKERLKNSKFYFTSKEWELLEETFQKIYYEVSIADGVFNKSEYKIFDSIFKNSKKIENQLFKELIENITVNYYFLFYYISKLDLENLLNKTNNLLKEKLSRTEVVEFKLNLIAFAYDLAYSSANFNSASIVQEEKVVLEKIIRFLDLNEEDLKLFENVKKNYPSSFLRTKFPSVFNISSKLITFLKSILIFLFGWISYSQKEQRIDLKKEFKELKGTNSSNKEIQILDEIESIILKEVKDNKFKSLNDFVKGKEKIIGLDKSE